MRRSWHAVVVIGVVGVGAGARAAGICIGVVVGSIVAGVVGVVYDGDVGFLRVFVVVTRRYWCFRRCCFIVVLLLLVLVLLLRGIASKCFVDCADSNTLRPDDGQYSGAHVHPLPPLGFPPWSQSCGHEDD